MLELKRQETAEEIADNLGLIHPGIMEVVSHIDRNDYTAKHVITSLMTGETALYIGYEDGKYRGFLLLTPCQVRFGPIYLLISAMFSILQSRDEWNAAYEEVIRPFALQHKCEWVEFRSERCGWEKVGPHFGFRKTYSIFRRDI